LIFTFCIFSEANAANLYFSPSSGSYTVGSSFSVSVYTSSADQAMNAASGVISFPQDKLEVSSISKSGSIISLWVQEPLFSNSAGTVSFEGIVLNPGFTGATGKIITINFRAKAAGTALLNFSSGSVLANDGKGTNILVSLGISQFSLGGVAPTVPEATTPSAVSGTPSAPQISSPTHPDPNKWYAKKDAKFTWLVPADVTRARLLVGRIPAVIPTVIYVPAINEKEVMNLDDGIWYFHVQLLNASGWGEIAHFRFQIDTSPPLPFEIEVREGKETTSPQPTLIFEATDKVSGIDHYEVKIDQEPPIEIKEKEYKIPVQMLGTHTIIVKAVDKAGNSTLAMTEINILSIEEPIITDYPQTLFPGAILLIKGTSVPADQVKIYIQKDEAETKIRETKSDKEGKWVYIEVKPVEKGVYKVWAEAIDSSGARSKPSEKVTIQVTSPVFIRIGELAIDYLTTIITLLILIGIIVIGILWILEKVRRTRKKLKKEISESERALEQAFKSLKEEIKEQIERLDGKPGLNKREEKICEDLKKALEISEKFIGKEIKDIEKEL
jgi:hypothetical protein